MGLLGARTANRREEVRISSPSVSDGRMVATGEPSRVSKSSWGLASRTWPATCSAQHAEGAIGHAPNFLLAIFGFPPTTEVFIRVVGVTVLIIGYLDINCARAELRQYFAWTVPARCSVFLFFIAFVLMGFAQPQLVIFGVVDLAGATWTHLPLRADKAALATA